MAECLSRIKALVELLAKEGEKVKGEKVSLRMNCKKAEPMAVTKHLTL